MVTRNFDIFIVDNRSGGGGGEGRRQEAGGELNPTLTIVKWWRNHRNTRMMVVVVLLRCDCDCDCGLLLGFTQYFSSARKATDAQVPW